MEKISSSLKEIKITAVSEKPAIKLSTFSHRTSQKMFFGYLGNCSSIQKNVWMAYYLYQHYDKKKSWLSFQQVADRVKINRSSVIRATKFLVANNLLIREKRNGTIYYGIRKEVEETLAH